MKEIICFENATASNIAERTKKVFDSMYSVYDIVTWNTIEMHEEARKIAIKEMREEGYIF